MPDPITPDVVYALVSVSGPSLAPDGSRVAFAKSEYDSGKKAHRSRIMVAELSGGEPQAFTQGDKDGSPSFSPDGTSIAFQRRRARPETGLADFGIGRRGAAAHVGGRRRDRDDLVAGRV